jgi:uncharacterized membrane protein YphA (DoxX/SURF4 family)
MKAAITIIRILVGVLFIISGLVKANDPLGLTYKMQEFFEIWNTGLQSSDFFLKSPLIGLFRFLHDHSLALSVIMITLEIMAGVALLLGWMKRFVLNLLLLLIVFFTFLTAYALFSKNPDGSLKFTNCGCFGDCLPIPPIASFTKDVVLLVLIIFLLAGKRYITPLFSRGAQTALLLFSLIASLGFQWYALNYLPPVDCLPFKVKNNIPQQMKIPPGAMPDSVAVRFVYEKGGKKYEFSPENFPADLGTYKFIDRTDKLIRKGNAEAPIKGFTLNAGNMDSTEIVLGQPASLLLFCLSLDGASSWMKDVKEVYAVAKAKQIPLYIATAAPLQQISTALNRNGLNDVQAFNTDNTVVRTAARTNPTLYHIEKGTIVNKYGRMNIKDAAADLKNH